MPVVALSNGAATARADDPPPVTDSASDSVYDGRWSLEYGMATKPGGFQVGTATVNLLFQAAKDSFPVDKTGSFAWEERENGVAHSDFNAPGNFQGATYEPFLRRRARFSIRRPARSR